MSKCENHVFDNAKPILLTYSMVECLKLITILYIVSLQRSVGNDHTPESSQQSVPLKASLDGQQDCCNNGSDIKFSKISSQQTSVSGLFLRSND